MSTYYTGVGSRKTPENIISIIRKVAVKLAHMGYWLRSGGALGADSAFESGAGPRKNIFYAADATRESMEIASRFHPAWSCCGDYARKLHGRNSFQVLGRDLITPSCFLICWTPDGAISHAERSIVTGVPVYNLARPAHLLKLRNFIGAPQPVTDTRTYRVA